MVLMLLRHYNKIFQVWEFRKYITPTFNTISARCALLFIYRNFTLYWNYCRHIITLISMSWAQRFTGVVATDVYLLSFELLLGQSFDDLSLPRASPMMPGTLRHVSGRLLRHRTKSRPTFAGFFTRVIAFNFTRVSLIASSSASQHSASMQFCFPFIEGVAEIII